MTDMPYGLVANVIWDRALRMGAKVVLYGWHGNFESAYVRGLSKGGRVISKYVPMHRLRSYRAAWLSPQMQEHAWLRFAEKQAAEACAAQVNAFWADVRVQTTDGQVLREGLSIGAIFTRAGLTTREEQGG